MPILRKPGTYQKGFPHLHLCHMRTTGPGAEEHRFLQRFPPWVRFRTPNVIMSFSQQSDVTFARSKHWRGVKKFDSHVLSNLNFRTLLGSEPNLVHCATRSLMQTRYIPDPPGPWRKFAANMCSHCRCLSNLNPGYYGHCRYRTETGWQLPGEALSAPWP